jgi:hypothetical protein
LIAHREWGQKANVLILGVPLALTNIRDATPNV